MKIVAFLQCLWVKDPPRVKLSLEHMETLGLREAMVARLLFHGGYTGNVLKRAFGGLCGKIVWEECTREIAGKSCGVFPSDPDHIRAVLKKHRPDVILTFGKIATKGVRACSPSAKIIEGPHPAMRIGSPVYRFQEMKEEIELMQLL